MDREVVIIETGLANVASLCAVFKRLEFEPILSSDVVVIEAASKLVLPGVGAFAAGMKMLEEKNLVEPLKERIVQGRSTLAICLGFQLLCESSEESPGIAGLGVLPVAVQRLPETVSVPQIGWNEIGPSVGCELLERAEMYFANSYYLPRWEGAEKIASAKHGVNFVAGVEQGTLLGCQFHPELSSKAGEQLLKRWLFKGDATLYRGDFS